MEIPEGWGGGGGSGVGQGGANKQKLLWEGTDFCSEVFII